MFKQRPQLTFGAISDLGNHLLQYIYLRDALSNELVHCFKHVT